MWVAAAIIWGFAEATLFFFVPDVLLTRAALKLGWVKAVRLCAFAALAAVLGGALMYLWGANNATEAYQLLDRIPAISPPLIADIAARISQGWIGAIFLGGLTGQPFKIFMVELGAQNVPWLAALLIGFLARFLRFFLFVSAASLVKKGLSLIIKPSKTLNLVLLSLWAVIWATVYLIYFSIFGF